MRLLFCARSARIWLLPVICVLSACQSPSALGSPTPTTSAASAAPSTVPAHSGPPIARFTLVLTAVPVATRGFQLYLSADELGPAPIRVWLCGGASATPCDPAHSPFSQVFRKIRAGTRIVFRFERILLDGTPDVVAQGSDIYGAGQREQRATYPPPAL